MAKPQDIQLVALCNCLCRILLGFISPQIVARSHGVNHHDKRASMASTVAR